MPACSVLVLSATASAINIIKSLQHESDLKLFVSDSSRYASGLYQSNVIPLLVPPARALDQYRAALDRIIADHKIDIVIPTSDRDVEGVVCLLDKGWTPPVAMFRPSFVVHQLLSSKLALAKHVRARGLPAPRTWETLDEAIFPAVVKPLSEGGGRDVTIVHDRDEGNKAIRRCEDRYGRQWLIQEYVPGGTGSTYVSLMLYNQSGALVAVDVMRSSLTYFTWGGGGNAGYLYDEQEIASASQAIVKAVGGWKGPLNFEFRRHAHTGKFYLIEANCRLNGYSYLTTMNGTNYPRAMVNLLTGRDAFLSHRSQATMKNFVLGLRENLVEAWVG